MTGIAKVLAGPIAWLLLLLMVVLSGYARGDEAPPAGPVTAHAALESARPAGISSYASVARSRLEP